MTVGSIIGLISLVLTILRYFIEAAEQQKWIDHGTAQTVLQALKDADDAIARAKKARALVRASHERDPSSVLRDDDGFRRPDD